MVKKLPLTVDAVNTAYDITTEQPQLFVTESCRHLSQILEEYGRHMCCSRGGYSALEEAREAATVCTVTTNSGLQVSGKISRVIEDAVGNAVYFNTEGPTQLAYQGQELPGHGIEYHSHGFGSPLGKLVAFERCLSSYTVDELKRHHIELNQPTELNYLSGIKVSGTLVGILRKEQKNILLSFRDCTVTNAQGDVLFNPAWGMFDMAVGDSAVSVVGGSADQTTYPLYAAPSSSATVAQEYDANTERQFALYQQVRDLREGEPKPAQLAKVAEDIIDLEDPDWLLVYECLELLNSSGEDKGHVQTLTSYLKDIQKSAKEDVKTLIAYGLGRLER